jgi:hypothetical protein
MPFPKETEIKPLLVSTPPGPRQACLVAEAEAGKHCQMSFGLGVVLLSFQLQVNLREGRWGDPKTQIWESLLYGLHHMVYHTWDF